MQNEPTLGHGKICYLEIPAADIELSARFYQQVFGWKSRRRGDGKLAFDDGVNQVSGVWVTGRKPIAETGILVYIMVDDIHQTIAAVTQQGGTIVQPLGGDFPELTARFTDPAGNLFGIFQQA